MTPATPTGFTRAHVTAQVASAVKVSPQISWSEAGLPKIAQHMFSLMLRNLASDGFLFMDPTHSDPNDPQSFSVPGCIIAAPSFPANTSGIDQDYVYNWTRDAATTAMEIAAAKMPTAPGSGVQPLIDYVNFAQTSYSGGGGNQQTAGRRRRDARRGNLSQRSSGTERAV